MTKNIKGGKNAKKMKRGGGQKSQARRELLYKEDGQEYAQVTALLGDGRFVLDCYDNVKRVGHIRGTMRGRVWVAVTDIVLIGLRDFDASRADIIHKYSPDEAQTLISLHELPPTAKVNVTAMELTEDFDDL